MVNKFTESKFRVRAESLKVPCRLYIYVYTLFVAKTMRIRFSNFHFKCNKLIKLYRSRSSSSERISRVFTNTQSWQCWHYCQLCIPIYLLFPTLFFYNYVSKCEIRFERIPDTVIRFRGCKFCWFASCPTAQPKQSWQCWHSCVMERL